MVRALGRLFSAQAAARAFEQRRVTCAVSMVGGALALFVSPWSAGTAVAQQDPSGIYVGEATPPPPIDLPAQEVTVECEGGTCSIDVSRTILFSDAPAGVLEVPVGGGELEFDWADWVDLAIEQECPDAPVPPLTVTVAFSGDSLVLTKTQEGGRWEAPGDVCAVTLLDTDDRWEGTLQAGTGAEGTEETATTAGGSSASSDAEGSSDSASNGSGSGVAVLAVGAAAVVAFAAVLGTVAARRRRGSHSGAGGAGQPKVSPVADKGRQSLATDGPALVTRVRAVADEHPRITAVVAPPADGSTDADGA